MNVADDQAPERTRARTRRRYLIPALSLVATLAAAGAFYAALSARSGSGFMPAFRQDSGATAFEGFAVSPPRPAPDIDMTAHTGQPFHLADVRGQAVLVFFGYTYCPDICPTTLARVSAALRELGDDAERVTMVFVTVDPKRDTLEGLARYLGNFSPRILGVRGDEATIASTARSYGVNYSVDAPEGATPDPKNYTISHSGYIFLIDPAGQLRAAFAGQVLPEEIAHDVRLVLDEAR